MKNNGLKYSLGALFLLVSVISFSQIDPSDGCAGVPILTANSSCVPNSYHMEGTILTNSGVDASCVAGQDRDDGWYQFVATNTTTEIDMLGNRNHVLAVWSACGGGTELACDLAGAGATATVTFATVIGTTYWIQMDRRQSNNNADMDGTICIHDPIPVNNDCDIATQICSSTSFSGNSNGFGNQELNAGNRGCLSSNEHESSWYLISIATTGTVQFTISPQNGTDDYDFAVWGPNMTCPPSAPPIRCSYAAGGGNTGVNTGINGESPQTTEGAGGDKYVDDLNVLAGEYYTLCVDNYTSSSSPFDFTFGGSAGISCVPLPVELIHFSGSIEEGINMLSWTTKSEVNNAYFTLERSEDAESWVQIGYITGANNSSSTLEYIFRDFEAENILNYYRLSQTDNDGTAKELGMIALNNANPNKKLVKIVNLVGEEVSPSYDGVMIYIFSDGTMEKRVRVDQ